MSGENDGEGRRERHPDAHLYETDKALYRDRVPCYGIDLREEEIRRRLYESDEALYSQGEALWDSDEVLFATKEDNEEKARRREMKRLKASAYEYEKEEETQCAVCLSQYAKGDRCVRLRCDHVYHEACLLKTLERDKRECPLCRKELFS